MTVPCSNFGIHVGFGGSRGLGQLIRFMLDFDLLLACFPCGSVLSCLPVLVLGLWILDGSGLLLGPGHWPNIGLAVERN